MSTASACRAIATSFSNEPLWSSVGAVSYQQNGCRLLAIATLLLPHAFKPQAHLIGALSGNEQNAAVPLDRVPEKRLAGCDCGCQIDCCEGLCGAPLTRQQPVPNSGQYMLHEPRCSRAGIG